ncbi:MAG: transcriptional regulator [Paenibacillus sp.]|nr:transcriptional regulator [Paenibacillus sp.]
MRKVGIIGYGTIGEDVAKAILQGEAGLVQLNSILVRDKSKFMDSSLAEAIITDNEDEFFNQGLDIVIECAGHEAVRKYGEKALQHDADLILVSVGAFADEALQKLLKGKAVETGRKIIVPSAAIGGLDRIAAGSIGPMEEVTLITRKPPKAWYGTLVEQQVNLAELSEPYCAKVKVFVDPHISHNTHEIEARGKFGQIKLQIQNTPSARNPKTGYIVAMSVIKTLRDMTASFVIGI